MERHISIHFIQKKRKNEKGGGKKGDARIEIRDIQHHRAPIRLDRDGSGLIEVRGDIGVSARLGGGQALGVAAHGGASDAERGEGMACAEAWSASERRTAAEVRVVDNIVIWLLEEEIRVELRGKVKESVVSHECS